MSRTAVRRDGADGVDGRGDEVRHRPLAERRARTVDRLVDEVARVVVEGTGP